jgi:hypothetical protein
LGLLTSQLGQGKKMMRFEVSRKSKTGYVCVNVNSVKELKSLVVGTKDLLIVDNKTKESILSHNIEFWAKAKHLFKNQENKKILAKAIKKSSYV